ncbi:hypothetical protein [Blautia producta]|uniref:hypothetical protein n=1 Tax=Blautia producta TaxID=33035 RepID=UPI0031B5BFF4
MSNDPRGTIIQQSNIMRIDNALVEEVFCYDNSVGHILISYAVRDADQVTSIQTLRLNTGRNTVILNMFGRRINACQLRKGMWINAVFSSRMTRSIPPQANAFLIIVKRNPRPQNNTTDGRIASVDPRNRFLITGNPDDINSQIRYTISDDTVILNRFGNPIPLRALRPGQMVRITHADFQTASIPPQTAAYRIQII